MSQQSSPYSLSSYPSAIHAPKLAQEGLQTPLRKQMLKSQRIDQQVKQQTMQKLNLSKSQNINVNEQDQMITPRPQRKLVLYDNDKHRYYFPLFKDKQIGMPEKFGKLVIDSWNDDDKQTSNSQLQRGKDQTMNDLYDYIGYPYDKSSSLNTEKLSRLSKRTC